MASPGSQAPALPTPAPTGFTDLLALLGVAPLEAPEMKAPAEDVVAEDIVLDEHALTSASELPIAPADVIAGAVIRAMLRTPVPVLSTAIPAEISEPAFLSSEQQAPEQQPQGQQPMEEKLDAPPLLESIPEPQSSTARDPEPPPEAPLAADIEAPIPIAPIPYTSTPSASIRTETAPAATALVPEVRTASPQQSFANRTAPERTNPARRIEAPAPVAFALRLTPVANSEQPQAPALTAITEANPPALETPIQNIEPAQTELTLEETSSEVRDSPAPLRSAPAATPAGSAPEHDSAGDSDPQQAPQEQPKLPKIPEKDRSTRPETITGAGVLQLDAPAPDAATIPTAPPIHSSTLREPMALKSDAAPVNNAAPVAAAPTDAPRTAAAHEIAVRVSAPHEQPVDVHVAQRGGELRVSVRAADQGMQSSLRQEVGQLVDRLEQKGFATEQVSVDAGSPRWEPKLNADSLANPLHRVVETSSSESQKYSQDREDRGARDADTGQQGSRQQHQQRRQQRQQKQTWEEFV